VTYFQCLIQKSYGEQKFSLGFNSSWREDLDEIIINTSFREIFLEAEHKIYFRIEFIVWNQIRDEISREIIRKTKLKNFGNH
jgi:hypothetical protein